MPTYHDIPGAGHPAPGMSRGQRRLDRALRYGMVAWFVCAPVVFALLVVWAVRR
jgi:hypothetical protein